MERTWIALLRGVNVGGRGKVPMAELRRALGEAGLEDVQTYIQSGNVVFTSAAARAKLAPLVEEVVAESFSVKTTVMVKTGTEIEQLIAAHPFGADTSRTYVTFLAGKPKPAAVKRLEALDVEPDRAVVAGAEVYLHHPNGAGRPRLTGAALERALSLPGTNRNWRTVLKLAELAGS
jgi:uncharacterized protein (DUF1697 family)